MESNEPYPATMALDVLIEFWIQNCVLPRLKCWGMSDEHMSLPSALSVKKMQISSTRILTQLANFIFSAINLTLLISPLFWMYFQIRLWSKFSFANINNFIFKFSLMSSLSITCEIFNASLNSSIWTLPKRFS